MKIKPSFSIVDPAHLTDGVFVPTKGMRRQKGPDDILYRPRLHVPERNFGDLSIGFIGFEQLGADDQSVLFAIAAQIGVGANTDDTVIVKKDVNNPVGKKLRLNFEFEGDDTGKTAAKKTTLRSLLIDAGYEAIDGANTNRIKQCLRRLRNAQIRETNETTGWERQSNILSYAFNKKTGETWVSLNPRYSSALFGESRHFIKVSLFERNCLESEPAKILHAWLSANIRLGGRLGNGNGVRIDTLLPHVWGSHTMSESRKVVSTRRGRLRDALEEIADKTKCLHKGPAGWVIEQTTSGLVSVSRPKTLPWQEDLGFTSPSDMVQELNAMEPEEGGKSWGWR
jgi:hypothetical protein